MRSFALIALIALIVIFAAPASAQVAVTHPAVSELALSDARLRDILLGRVTTWADGTPIVIVLVEEEDSAAATAQLSGRDLGRLLRGWKRLVYAGSGAMPLVVSSARDALDEVRRRPGAVTVLALAPMDATEHVVPEK